MPLLLQHQLVCNHYLVGLTGGMGSGKSFIAHYFQRYDIPVVDTDRIAHQLTQKNGAAIDDILNTFGADYLDETGSMHRKKIRALILNDALALQQLETILHPLIYTESLLQLSKLGTHHQYAIIMVPLLIEKSTWLAHIQRLLVIDCPECIQIQRVQARSQLSPHTIQGMMNKQASRALRLSMADDVLYNHHTHPDAIHLMVQALHESYLSQARVYR